MFVTFATDTEIFLAPAASITVCSQRKDRVTVHNHLTGQTHTCVGTVAYHETIMSAVIDANQIADDTDQEAFVIVMTATKAPPT